MRRRPVQLLLAIVCGFIVASSIAGLRSNYMQIMNLTGVRITKAAAIVRSPTAATARERRALERQAATAFGGPSSNASACLDTRWAAHDAQQGLSALLRRRHVSRVLEIGCYVGYACVELAHFVGPGGAWYQVVDHETPHLYIDHVRQSLRVAGLERTVSLLVGTLETAAASLIGSPFDVILLNHWEV